MKKLLVFFLLISCVFSLKAQETLTTEMYIDEYADWAVDEMKRTGIPASITLAQGILESGSGNSQLAVEAKNHFGIKCHSDWIGEKIYHDDDADQECFRKYKNAYESFKDHSEFLMKYSRYAFLFDLEPTDYVGWARGLKKAGYATNPKYADILIGLIERHNLQEYDKGVKPQTDKLHVLADGTVRNRVQPGFSDNWVIDPYDREIIENNGRQLIVARRGDNITALAQEFDMAAWQLYQYNDMNKSDDISAGQFVYLEPKRNRADRGFEKHVVEEDESLWEVSQRYGVKEKKLRRRNGLGKNDRVKPGDEIYLRTDENGNTFLGLF
ncbi:MAG: glucosaminidase domain-containing protein [Bacteroidales bacterium]